MPLVSVILPVFNYSHFLDQAAASLMDQTEKDWECLIVDDGSTDSTAAVSDEWVKKDPRFRYFFQPNQGLSSARNLGLRHAAGELVQFLDADDWLEPDKLARQARFLKECPGIDIVYGEALYVDEKKLLPAVFSDCLPDALAALVKENVAAVNAFLVRKSALDEIGPFDENLKAYEDWDVWLRCAFRRKKFLYVPAGEGTRALVRVHAGSMIRDRRRMLSALVQVRCKILPEIMDAKILQANQRLLIRDEGRLACEELKEGITARRLGKISLAVMDLWR